MQNWTNDQLTSHLKVLTNSLWKLERKGANRSRAETALMHGTRAAKKAIKREIDKRFVQLPLF